MFFNAVLISSVYFITVMTHFSSRYFMLSSTLIELIGLSHLVNSYDTYCVRYSFSSFSFSSDSIADVLVRANQLVSTMESMYSGENIVIISPDSDNLSILQAALSDENPDLSLPKHSRFWFKNGEVRELVSTVKPLELLVTGQTQTEADAVYRKMKALRVGGKWSTGGDISSDSWVDLWHLSVDRS